MPLAATQPQRQTTASSSHVVQAGCLGCLPGLAILLKRASGLLSGLVLKVRERRLVPSAACAATARCSPARCCLSV